MDSSQPVNVGRIFEETEPGWLHKFVINLIKCGEVPSHIAIIMDGNRRYGKNKQLAPRKSYSRGLTKIPKILKYCEYLGIKEVTVFAFSIENFKRDPAEVELLMNMGAEQLSVLLAQRDKLVKYDLCVRFIGNLTLFPAKVQKMVAELILFTKDHKGVCLNLCAGYTSSDELSTATNKLYDAVNQNVLSDEISIEHLNACLLTNRSRSDPDILIRTSGEIRFSDFLLMQCNYSSLLFTPCLWPEMTLIEVLKLIIRYQMGQRFNVNARVRKVIKSGEQPPNSELRAHVNGELEKVMAELLVK